MAPLADFLLAYAPLPTVPYTWTHYVQGETPLSTYKVVFAALVAYLAVIFGIQEVMRSQKPLKLQLLCQAHNLFLTFGSGLLLALCVEEVVPLIYNHGLFHAMCNTASWTPRLEFYYMINYSFKYIELLDTVFLALKKKPLAFLHVFHHSATAFLCFTQLNGKTSISWVPIVLNLSVHVLMYYYFYATAGGRRIWWKKHLTTMQITQFVIDLIALYFAAYQYYAFKYFPNTLPTLGTCAGTEASANFGLALITSYLFLFINFYIQTYNKPAKAKKVANGNGVPNGKVPNGTKQ